MEKETARTAAFSEGVFAIAITQLILEIQSAYFVIAIFFNVLWWYVNHANLLGHDTDLSSAEKISKQYAVGPLLYLICLH